jgi:DNA-directed RNA polymerase specialized sigma24 family protein
LDHNQIAHAMGVRPGTVRSLLSRASARLREVIEP